MLASTLKVLQRDGLVTRTVTPSVPSQMEYELTALGRDPLPRVVALASRTMENTGTILAAREAPLTHDRGLSRADPGQTRARRRIPSKARGRITLFGPALPSPTALTDNSSPWPGAPARVSHTSSAGELPGRERNP